MAMNEFDNNSLTKQADKAKPSYWLPLAGTAVGLGSHLIQRGSLDKKDKDYHLLRSLLLGGMAGTGAELMRLGVLNGYKRFRGQIDSAPPETKVIQMDVQK